MHKRNFKTVIVITVIEQRFDDKEISCQNQGVLFRVLFGAENLQECYFLCTFATANQS